MRNTESIKEAVKNLSVIHGAMSEVVAREKSLLALAYLNLDEPDYDQAFQLLNEASDTIHELELEGDEPGLDIDYRLGKALESRATTEEQENRASEILMHVFNSRLALDNNKPAEDRDPVAPLEEEMDSTMIYFDQAYVDHREGNLKSAIKYMEKCVDLRKKKFGEKSAALCTPLLGLADLLREVGNHSKAKECLHDALMFAVKAYGRVDLRTAEILNSFGNLLRICTEFQQSEEYLKECLEARKQILGEESPQVAATINNLAELYREMNDFMKAIEFHKLSVSTFESSVGSEHPGTINAKGNYGVTLQRLAKLSAEDGDALLEEAIDYMHQKGYDKEHPWLLKFGNEYILNDARKLSNGKQFERSIELFDTLIMRKQMAIEGGGETSENASVKSALNSIRSAELVAEGTSLSSLEMKALSYIEFERFETMLKWSQSLLDTSKFQAAIEVVQQCEQFAVNRIPSPPESETERKLTFQLLIVKSQISRILGQYSEALSQTNEIVSLSEMTGTTHSLEMAKPYLFLSDLHCELAQFKEAETYCMKVSSKLWDVVAGNNGVSFFR
jgi:tetratricopeptide (TPR) repeat protein